MTSALPRWWSVLVCGFICANTGVIRAEERPPAPTDAGAAPEIGAEPVPEARLSPSEIYAAVKDSVVVVRTEEGLGAGFLVGNQRLIATAFHVISRGGPIAILSRNEGMYTATVESYDRDHDLAVLKLDRDLAGGVPLPLAVGGDITIGDPVVVIGHPFGTYADNVKKLKGLLSWTVTSGVVGAVNQDSIQTDAAINPGNSGGPLLDVRGRILGVVSSQLKDANNVGFAVHARYLQALLDRKTPSPPLVAPPLRMVGIGWSTLSTDEKLWASGFFLTAQAQPRGSGLRRGLSIGYQSVDDLPRSGRWFNYHENLYWIQADVGLHVDRIRVDILGGLSAGWRKRATVNAYATMEDPSCEPGSSNACELSLRFDTDSDSSFKLFGMAGAKFTRLLDVFDVGAGVYLDPLQEPRLRWRIWVELLDRT